MVAGFYGLLAGIYILLFGYSPILPWGLCQNCFLRKQIKDDLHEQYPKSIPLIEPPSIDKTVTERIDDLERFLKQFICDVDYMEELVEDEEAEEEMDNEHGGDVEEENVDEKIIE
ncbi:6563_t:CDS:2 [Funneliformis mosseae]|uniref:6563_t:CDS:1 n=1 Tax=Funneliformis mosseae TaxID=27381 RepID=A0A9N9CHZ1_FUNMO|nr:6563_t:CDS:2 [Funneliformis mosseae]